MKKLLVLLLILNFTLIFSIKVNAEEDIPEDIEYIEIPLEDFTLEGYIVNKIEAGTNPDSYNFVENLRLFANGDDTLIEEKILVQYNKDDFNKPGETEIRLYVIFNDNDTPKYIGKPITITITDKTPPKITGTDPIYTTIGAEEPDYLKGIKVFDNDISTELNIKVFSEAVNLSKPGVYKVNYFVVDQSGNVTETYRYVCVQDSLDLTLPEIKVNQDVFNININTSEEKLREIYLSSVTAKDGTLDITEFVQFDDSAVNYNKLSEVECTGQNNEVCDNYVVFMVNDSDGNFKSVKIPVNIIKDDDAPFFTNLGDELLFTVQSKTLTDDEIKNILKIGIKAYDDVCGDVTSRIEINLGTNFKHNVKDDYEVTFTVSDLNEKQISKRILVRVIDNAAPVIDAPTTLYLKKNGLLDLTDKIKVSDNYDTNIDYVLHDNDLNAGKVGTYIINISAKDSDDNESIHKITVFVYSTEPDKIYENPVIVGIVVAIFASGIITLGAYFLNLKSKRRRIK